MDYMAAITAAFANTKLSVIVAPDPRDPEVMRVKMPSDLTPGQRRYVPTILGAAGFYVIGSRRRRGFVPEQFTVRHRSTMR